VYGIATQQRTQQHLKDDVLYCKKLKLRLNTGVPCITDLPLKNSCGNYDGRAEGRIMLRVLNHCGASKSPNNVTSTFFNTVRLLPKDLRFDHGASNLPLAPGAI